MIKGGQGRDPKDVSGGALVVGYIVFALVIWLAIYGAWRLLTG